MKPSFKKILSYNLVAQNLKQTESYNDINQNSSYLVRVYDVLAGVEVGCRLRQRQGEGIWVLVILVS